MFFIVPDKHLSYFIPDYEHHSCYNLFYNTTCHESYFGLARLHAFQSKFYKALEYLDKALDLSQDPLYLTWQSAFKIKTANKTENEVVHQSFFKRFLCCNPTSRKATIIDQLEKLPESVEVLWCYLEASIKGLAEIEPPQYYATKIKTLDLYYSYLAWSEIFLRKNDREAGVNLLKEIIRTYGNRPEAYVKIWNYFYYIVKDYEQAEDAASEALFKLSHQSNFQYYILFCVYTAKVYYKQKRFKECFLFLQRKFMEHPTYPVFLYIYGKLCTKIGDFKYNGSAISVLKESAKLCDDSRSGLIYYWLSKAFILARLQIDAYEAANEALKHLNPKHSKKILELKAWVSQIHPSIIIIEKIQNELKYEFTEENYKKCKQWCKDLKDLHKLTVDVLQAKMLWQLGNQDEAIKKLYSVCGITTVKMTGYFVLLDCLEQQKNYKCMKTVAHEMLSKCRNCLVPSYIWTKVNIIYAKILVRNGKPGKAILVLKSLAKLLPPFPFVDIQYTKILQRAKSIQDLTEAHSKTIASLSAYTYSTYKNSFIEPFTNTREFSKKLIEEENAHKMESSSKKLFQRRVYRMSTESLDSSNTYLSSFLIKPSQEDGDKVSPIPDINIPDSSNIENFSICSDPIFLYKIARISFMHRICIQDGIFALRDYMELIKFDKDKNQQEEHRAKALVLYSLLLEKAKE